MRLKRDETQVSGADQGLFSFNLVVFCEVQTELADVGRLELAGSSCRNMANIGPGV